MTAQDVLRRIVEVEEAKRERRWLAEQEAARTAPVAASPRPQPRPRGRPERPEPA